MQHSKKLLAILVAGALGSGGAFATNGYAPHGIGMKSKGMGGVTIAHQGDAVALGGNPAGSVWMEDRIDVGVDFFSPDRTATISDSVAQLPDGEGGAVFVPNFYDGTFDGNDTSLFAIPEFGYRRGLGGGMAFGLSVFGNGGMNTDYADGLRLFNSDQFGNSQRTGINLSQLFIVPSIAFKINEQNSLGIGLNLVAQGFEAKGINNFDNPNFSTSSGNVTNNDTSWAYGAGVRLGWMGKASDRLTFGATYQSRTYMSEFDEYAGLFAEQGDFDVPSNYGVGVAFQATPELLISGDIVRINYGEVASISNSSTNLFNCPAFAQQFGQPGDPSYCLGGENGPGFGWTDMTVYKLGVEYAFSSSLTLRAGYNYGESPIKSDETVLNILAPGVVEQHLTLGGTWTLDSGTEITLAYMHALEKTVYGDPSNFLGGGTADITMSQDSLGIGASWKL